MAVHHYQVLRTQTPVNSTVSNNLSLIYDESGASVNKISLLRGAQRRKDSAYVSANLAIAYAKSGFIGDARDCLKHVPVGEQQEAIVQAAYQTIQTEIDFDRHICERIDSLVSVQQDLVENKAMPAIIDSDEQLANKFIGTWKLDEATVVTVAMKNGNWGSGITTANTHYEHAAYEVTTVYEPGLLQLNADLDEGSLKERSVPKEAHGLAANALLGPISGIGSMGAANLLGRAFTRPDRRLKLVLIAGEDANTLYGMEATGFSSDGKENEKPQLMLGAKQVHLTRQA